jgi:phytoene synthase
MLEAHCEKTMQAGSKSFSLAARFFPLELREAASFVYAWCRYCDDQIDDCPSREEGLKRLALLREKTLLAFQGSPTHEPVFQAFSRVVRKYDVPQIHAFELLDGMEMDLNLQTYATMLDLRVYCYCVAGTVGLMMAHVMGVKDQKVLRYASELGIAMQLTNISRDVLEDSSLGRCYLPISWLQEEGISASDLAQPRNRGALARVTRRVLLSAESAYFEGNQGIAYLPWRASLAIGAASYIYRAIGWKVKLRGKRAWDSRTVISKPVKIFLSAIGILRATFSRSLTRSYGDPA